MFNIKVYTYAEMLIGTHPVSLMHRNLKGGSKIISMCHCGFFSNPPPPPSFKLTVNTLQYLLVVFPVHEK